jgi:hypothetical protein
MSQAQVFKRPPLLNSESRDEFDAFHKGFREEIRPSGAIEQMYMDEFIDLCWESQRLRRWKATILDTARRVALEHLLQQLPGKFDRLFHDIGDDPEDVSRLYFVNEDARTAVSTILARFELDESAIEAQAWRDTLPDLDLIERQLASVEARRDGRWLILPFIGRVSRRNCGKPQIACSNPKRPA